MDKGAGLSVGGISKIASSNKKITLRDCILECDFFAVCGCSCGPKAFPLIDQSVGKLFSVCSLPLSGSIGNLLLPFCNTQILRRHKTKNRSKRNLPKHTVSKEFSRLLVAQQTDTGASIFASMLGVTDAFSYQH